MANVLLYSSAAPPGTFKGEEAQPSSPQGPAPPTSLGEEPGKAEWGPFLSAILAPPVSTALGTSCNQY